MTDFAKQTRGVIERFADDPGTGAAAVSLHAEVPRQVVIDMIRGARQFGSDPDQDDVVAAFLAGFYIGALHAAEHATPEVVLVVGGIEHRPKQNGRRPRRHGR